MQGSPSTVLNLLTTTKPKKTDFDTSRYQAQAHQDETVNKLVFNGMTEGFFMEFGAGDGKTFSNTYFFEKELNWNGVLVEPVLKHYNEIKISAKRNCAVVHGAICSKSGQRVFLDVTNMQGWSGFEDEMSIDHLTEIQNGKKNGKFKIENVEINCYKFRQILDIFNIKIIDYLAIDVEGYELNILKSIPFNDVIINVIQIELNENHSEIRKFLKEKGYDLPWRIDENHYDDIYIRNGEYSETAKKNAGMKNFTVGCGEGMGCRKVIQCDRDKLDQLQCTQNHKINA